MDAEVRPSLIPVIALAALHQALAALELNPADESFSLSYSTMPVIIGVLQLVFGVLVGPFLLAFIGGWLGGDADPAEIRQAVAWSYVPFAAAAFCWFPILVAYGGPPSGNDGPQNALQWLAMLFALGVLVAFAWSAVLQVITLAEVQRFSIGRALMCIIILAIPIVLLGSVA